LLLLSTHLLQGNNCFSVFEDVFESDAKIMKELEQRVDDMCPFTEKKKEDCMMCNSPSSSPNTRIYIMFRRSLMYSTVRGFAERKESDNGYNPQLIKLNIGGVRYITTGSLS
jgi:hypothetical protein